MEAKGFSYKGMREKNEDSYLIEMDSCLFAVADGMGGHKAGEVASSLAVAAVKEYLSKTSMNSQSPLEKIKKAAEEANRKIYSYSYSQNTLESMGTTLTVLWSIYNTAYIAHVGDSRAYLLREGSLKMITSDHSLVYEMFQRGNLTKMEADSHPDRNILTRAVGVENNVQVDVEEFPLKVNDVFLLCSDGLSGAIPEDEIKKTINESNHIDDCCEQLAAKAWERGGKDNITVVLIYFN